MAQDKQLPQLDAATISNDTDLLLTTQSGVAKKITAGLVRGKLLSQANTWTQPQTMPKIAGIAKKTTLQTLPGGNTATLVAWDASPEYDPFGLWDSANKRFALNKAGLWRITADLAGSSMPAGPGTFFLTAEKVGTGGGTRRLDQLSIAGLDDVIAGNCLFISDGTHYARILANNSDANPLNMGSPSADASYFEVEFIGS